MWRSSVAGRRDSPPPSGSLAFFTPSSSSIAEIRTNGEPPGLDVPEYCEKLDALNIPILTEPILRVVCEGNVIHSLELRDGMHLDADKIFLAIGQFPADDAGTKLSLQLGCERDDEGHVVVDTHYHTSVHNVFAAGDR